MLKSLSMRVLNKEFLSKDVPKPCPRTAVFGATGRTGVLIVKVYFFLFKVAKKKELELTQSTLLLCLVRICWTRATTYLCLLGQKGPVFHQYCLPIVKILARCMFFLAFEHSQQMRLG